MSRRISRPARGTCALLICCSAWSLSAHAEVTIAEARGFRLYTEGRVNTFASLGFGDELPAPSPNVDGGPAHVSTEIDFTYGHNYGLGYPCGDAQGPTCGHIGTGVMFPGFAAGFQYSTPPWAGLRLHVGLYDPVRLLGAWNRAPVPRPEAALSLERSFGAVSLLKFQAEGMLQPVSRLRLAAPGVQTQLDDTVWGVAAGARLEVGPLRFGTAAFRGKGLGQYYALQNSPVVFNTASYEIRSFTGLYAQAALVLGQVQLSVGVGRVSIDQLEVDKRDPLLSNAKSQTGVSAAVYYSCSDNLVLGLDYFRFQADWYGAPRSTLDATSGMTELLPGMLAAERQVVSYLNAGATYHW